MDPRNRVPVCGRTFHRRAIELARPKTYPRTAPLAGLPRPLIESGLEEAKAHLCALFAGLSRIFRGVGGLGRIAQFLAMAFHFAQRIDGFVLRLVVCPRHDLAHSPMEMNCIPLIRRATASSMRGPCSVMMGMWGYRVFRKSEMRQWQILPPGHPFRVNRKTAGGGWSNPTGTSR